MIVAISVRIFCVGRGPAFIGDDFVNSRLRSTGVIFDAEYPRWSTRCSFLAPFDQIARTDADAMFAAASPRLSRLRCPCLVGVF